MLHFSISKSWIDCVNTTEQDERYDTLFRLLPLVFWFVSMSFAMCNYLSSFSGKETETRECWQTKSEFTMHCAFAVVVTTKCQMFTVIIIASVRHWCSLYAKLFTDHKSMLSICLLRMKVGRSIYIRLDGRVSA